MKKRARWRSQRSHFLPPPLSLCRQGNQPKLSSFEVRGHGWRAGNGRWRTEKPMDGEIWFDRFSSEWNERAWRRQRGEPEWPYWGFYGFCETCPLRANTSGSTVTSPPESTQRCVKQWATLGWTSHAAHTKQPKESVLDPDQLNWKKDNLQFIFLICLIHSLLQFFSFFLCSKHPKMTTTAKSSFTGNIP